MYAQYIIDGIVILCIVIMAVIGLKTGFIKTIYRFLSMLIAFYISVKIYPFLTKFLMSTPIADALKGDISASIKGKLAGTSISGMDQVMTKLDLPSFVKDWVTNSGEAVDNSLSAITKALSNAMTEMVLSIACLFIIFILAFLLLILIKSLLNAIVKLPILKQLDKGAGFVVGTVTGMLIAYLVSACIVIFGGTFSNQTMKNIDKTYVAKYFVKNNYIVSVINQK